MELDQINALPDAAKAQYMALEKLYSSPGFGYLQNWAKAQAQEAAERIVVASSWDQHLINKGRLEAYQSFVSLEDNSEKEFENLADTILEQRLAAKELAEELTDY